MKKNKPFEEFRKISLRLSEEWDLDDLKIYAFPDPEQLGMWLASEKPQYKISVPIRMPDLVALVLGSTLLKKGYKLKFAIPRYTNYDGFNKCLAVVCTKEEKT